MIYELIKNGAVAPAGKIANKDAALRQAAELLAGKASGLNSEEIYKSLSEREALGSTGIGDSIAIPHATGDKLDEFRMVLITIPGGVDFDAIDGKPVKVIFAMLGPASRRSEHVRILAALSRLSKKDDFVNRLAAVSSAEDVLTLLRKLEGDEAAEIQTVEKSLLIAMVQEENYLEPLLEVLASVSFGGISVLDGYGAGRYLHTMPLFSMFWTDENRKDDVKVVLAVIDRHLGNDVIRRISATVADPGKDSGLMIALQQLSLVSGSLDL